VMIQEVNSWVDIPKDPSILSFKETDALLREMKSVLAKSMRMPKYAEDKWWYWSIFTKLKYRYIGEWFFDSLIAVNAILQKENRPYSIPTLWGHHWRYGANRLARIVPTCYRYLEGQYSWSVYASFYRDEDREFVLEQYDLTEMIKSGWWPGIVSDFGLLPERYEREKNDE
jgi:hypothetical protein